MKVTKTLRLTLAVPVLVLTSLCLDNCSERGGAIRYGGHYYACEFVLKGDPDFWNRRGLEVEHILFSSGTENNQALVTGGVDVNVGSDSKTVALFAAIPQQALIIGTIQKGDRYATAVQSDSHFRSWKDLIGQTVATRLGTGAEQVLRRYFEKEKDLRWHDFSWVNLKVEDMISTLRAGRIAAFSAWEPWPSIAEAQGLARIIRTYGDIAPVPVCVHTTVDFASKHRDKLVLFLAVHLEKAKLIREQPGQAATLAVTAARARGHDVSEEVFLNIFRRVDFSIEFDNRVLDAIRDTGRFLYEQGRISGNPQLRWDRSILEDAKKLIKK
jgi:ABC-type nitrate/sulfonate/bicarbonate transport system substrate-binding protein